MIWIVVFLILIFLAVFIITGILITRSAVQIKKIDGYDTNSKLQEAHKNASIAASITWIIVGISAILLILGFYFGIDEYFIAKAASGSGIGIFAYFCLFVLLVLTIINGIFAIYTSENIKYAPNYDPTDTATRNARYSAIWAAILSFASIGILVIIYILYGVYRRQSKKKAKENQKTETKTES